MIMSMIITNIIVLNSTTKYSQFHSNQWNGIQDLESFLCEIDIVVLNAISDIFLFAICELSPCTFLFTNIVHSYFMVLFDFPVQHLHWLSTVAWIIRYSTIFCENHFISFKYWFKNKLIWFISLYSHIWSMLEQC
jgi:hypothetical protein